MKRPDWRIWLASKLECERWNTLYQKNKMLRKRALKSGAYLKKALHNLDFANWICEKHRGELKEVFGEQRFFDWAIVIYYYAIYHAALALIASKGLFSKSHLATLNALILHFYHEEKISKVDVEAVAESVSKSLSRPLERGDIEMLSETKELRERATYGVSYQFEESLVKTAKENATSFIRKTRGLIE